MSALEDVYQKIEGVRMRHANCDVPCDADAVLGEIDRLNVDSKALRAALQEIADGRVTANFICSYAAAQLCEPFAKNVQERAKAAEEAQERMVRDRIRQAVADKTERLYRALASSNTMIRSLRAQRAYLAANQAVDTRKVGQHREHIIKSLRLKLRNVREQLDLQTEATKRQRDKVGRAGRYAYAMKQRAEEAEAGAAALRLVLERIGGSSGARPTGSLASELARHALDNATAGVDLLADYRRALASAEAFGFKPGNPSDRAVVTASEPDMVTRLTRRNNLLWAALNRAAEEIEVRTGERPAYLVDALSEAPARVEPSRQACSTCGLIAGHHVVSSCVTTVGGSGLLMSPNNDR